MQVLEVKKLPNGDFEYEIDLTKDEREMIKKAKGWKRLTRKRLQSWYEETLNKNKSDSK